MDQKVASQLQLFLKEIDARSVGIISVDGLVDSVLRHSNLLKQISFAKKDAAAVDMSSITMVFTEIVKQIYSSILCYSFSGNQAEISLPWVSIAHSLSLSLNTAVSNCTLPIHAGARKRLRYHRQNSRASRRINLSNKAIPDSDSPATAVIAALRQQLNFIVSSLDMSGDNERGWRSLCAVTQLLHLLVSHALDGAESRSIPGYGFASLSSLFSMAADILENVLQSSPQQDFIIYPLLIVIAICLSSMPFHDTSSDLRLPMLRWISLLDDFSKSTLLIHSKLMFDFCLITIKFTIFNYMSSSHSPNSSLYYTVQNVNKMLSLVRNFLSTVPSSDEHVSDVYALLLRFVSFLIQSVRLNRVKINLSLQNHSSRTCPPNVVATAATASGAHCCSLTADTCCIRTAVELATTIVSVSIPPNTSDEVNGLMDASAVDQLLAELVRSGACCCCFTRGSDVVAALLRSTSNLQRPQTSLLAVNVCIRIFLDYHPRTDITVQGQHSSCPFFFSKESSRNDVLAEYVALPLVIFTSKVNLSRSASNDTTLSEESCFQIARQILTLTSTSAFRESSEAKHFLFRHLVGPLFDWVMAACFDQTDLFISRKALPIVIRILEDFLGDKDLSYFADFASTSRLSCLSRLFEAGNGFCYIISLIRILVRCPLQGTVFLSNDAVSQLDVVKKVAVSTFLPAFYSATKRLTNALYSTDEDTSINVSCHDLQIFSHCFFMLDESQYFTATFVNQQSTEAFIALIAAFEHYVTRRHPPSYSKEFVHLFVYVMASVFRLKSLENVSSLALSNIRFLSSHHEFYSLLRLSFDSMCALLTPRAPLIDHWCIIRDCRKDSAPTDEVTESESPDDTYTSSVGELQMLIGQSDAANISDGASTADTDYEADEDEVKEYSFANASDDNDGDLAYREIAFGNAGTMPNTGSFVCFVGPRFYLALELVKILCRFIRHSRNCLDQSCPTRLAELTCSLESVLAMITQARVDSFSSDSIESVFDMIFSGDLHPFLLNTEHNWHTIQHQLFCLLANLGSRHVTPRHLCSLFRMTTSESVSLVSAATNCLTKLAVLSDLRSPPFCVKIGPPVIGSNSTNIRSPMPVKWQPGKCCVTLCFWMYLEGLNDCSESPHSTSSETEPPSFPLCSVGSTEFFIHVGLMRRSKGYEGFVVINLNGRAVTRKLHLAFIRYRWHMLTIQIRDEMILNKDQYYVIVTATLDCEHVSTASSAWPVEEVPRKEIDFKTVPYFSAPAFTIGAFDGPVNEQSTKKSKISLHPSPPADSWLLAGTLVFSTWLEAVELLQLFARLPAWISQPLSSFLDWPSYPSMCVTPSIIDDNPRAFTQNYKQAPEFLTSLCLIMRPTLSRSEWAKNMVAAEFIRVSVNAVSAQDQQEASNRQIEHLEFKKKSISSVVSSSVSLLSRIECANFHNSVLQVGGPDFLMTWLSSLASITHVTVCRHLMLAGVDTVLTSIRHPHIYLRFVEMGGFEMLYQLLMLKIVPHGASYLDESLITILINASLSRPILTTSSDCADTVFTSPSSFAQLSHFRIRNWGRSENCRDAGALVQIPEIWSQILLNSEFLIASSRLSCWRLVFSTVSLLVSSSSNAVSHAPTSSDSEAIVSSTASFNRAVFSRMEFPCRCYAVLRSFSAASSANELSISDIVLASLGDFLLAMNDPSAIDILVDFLVALHPLSAFFVDISPTDLFPSFLFSHPYNYRSRPVSSRLSQSSGGGSFSVTNGSTFSLDFRSPTNERRNSSAPTLTPVMLLDRWDKADAPRVLQDSANSATRLLSTSDPTALNDRPKNSGKSDATVDDSSVMQISQSGRRRNRRRAGVMVRLIEVLDAILRKHPHAAYARLFKCIRPESLLFFLGGGNEELMPSVDFSCRLLHTFWQSLIAAECRIASDLFLKERGPILISFQITRALGNDVEPMLSVSLTDDSYQSLLFGSLSSYYYELICRNVATLEQVTEGPTTAMRHEGIVRTYGCKCSSLSAAVKTACPAKVVLNLWWSLPAVELAVCSLFSLKNTPESRSLLRLVAAEFFLTYTYLRPPLGTISTADSDGINRVWSLISAKMQMIWLLLLSATSSVGDKGVEEATANSGQRLNFEQDVEQSLTCCLTFILAVLSSNSFSSTSDLVTEDRPGRMVDSQALFLSLINTMSSAFPEIGVANHWLIAALKQFDHVCDLMASSVSLPQSLPLVRKAAPGSSGLGPDSTTHTNHTRSSVSMSIAVSFTVSDDEEDDDDSEDMTDSAHNITPTFEKCLSLLLQKQSGIVARFVEMVASHIRRWPNAPASGDLAKALLLFVCKQVESGAGRGIAADAGCLMASCAAAVSTKSIDMLFITEIIHAWMTSGTTALASPSRQWRNVQSAVFVATGLSAYDVEKGSCLLPTQRSRLKEVIVRLPSTNRTSLLAHSASQATVNSPDDAALIKLRRCCDTLLPLADRIAEMNKSGREQHHSKRKNLTLPSASQAPMKIRLQLIEVVRRFAHPAAPMGDVSMVSTLYPDEWELDPVEGTLGVYLKLRRQALSIPAGKVVKEYSKHPSLAQNLDSAGNDLRMRRSATAPNTPGSPGKVVARPTFLGCDCNNSADNPAVVARDWTFLVRTFGSQLASAVSGFLSAIVQVLSSTSKVSSDQRPYEAHVDLSCQCTLVTPSACVDGEMFVTEDLVIFLSHTASAEDIYRQFLFDLHSGVPYLVTFPLNSVSTVYPRRYLLKENALEVFLTSGKAYFFAFNPETVEIDGGGRRKTTPKPLPLSQAHEVCDRVRSVLIAKCRIGSTAIPSPNELQVKWLKGQLTNFEYLTLLNRAGGRSNNELMQYPVFPWVLADYISATIDLALPSSYRDLGKHIALQPHAAGGEDKVTLRYAQLQAEGSTPYHFPSLYSNSGIVAHYLVRIPPFTQACLLFQDGNFDIPDRTFSSFAATWSIADVKELLPEFFYLPEFLTNFCHLNLGVCQSGMRVWDVALPPWAGNNPRRFILVHRQALESAFVRTSLPKWIDLIFGFRQIGKGAIDACNVFHPSTYFSSAMSTDLEALLADPLLFAARQAQIRTYGQVPRQLFEFAHSSAKSASLKKTKTSENLNQLPDELNPGKSDMFGDDISLSGLSVGNYAGSHAKLICVWQVEFPLDVSNDSAVDVAFADPSNLVVLVASPTCPKTLWTLLAPQKQKRRNLLQSSSPNVVGLPALNYFSIDVTHSLAGGFSVSTTKRLQTWSAGTAIDIAGQDIFVNQFYATGHHDLSCGPVYSFARHTLFFGTTVGLILAYVYEVDEFDLTSEQAEDRLPLVSKTPVQVLCAHETAAAVTAIAVSDEFKLFVAGTADGRCVFFDLNSLSFVRQVVLNPHGTVITSPVKMLAISSTMGDVAAHFESGNLALFTVNGSLIGQTNAPKNVASMEFSSCPEGTSVNCLLVASNEPASFTFYCAWDLRLVRKVCLEDIPVADPAVAVPSTQRRKTFTMQRPKFGENVITACYSRPDSQLLAVLHKNRLCLYANYAPSTHATAAMKNMKLTLIS